MQFQTQTANIFRGPEIYLFQTETLTCPMKHICFIFNTQQKGHHFHCTLYRNIQSLVYIGKCVKYLMDTAFISLVKDPHVQLAGY